MRVKINDILLFLIPFLFFIAQIFTGTMTVICFFAFWILCFINILKNKYNIIPVVFFVLLSQIAIQRISIGVLVQFSYYIDEIFELVSIIIILFVLLNKKIIKLERLEKIILFLFLLYVFCATISSVYYSYNTIINEILDCFVCIKFVVLYIAGLLLARERIIDADIVYKYLNTLCKFITIILLVLSLHDIFLTPFFEKFDYRFFTYSLQLCFRHPTYLAAVCITLMAVLMLNMEKDKSNFRYIILLSVVLILTFRTKAIGTSLLIFLIYFVYIRFRLKGKILFLIVGIFIVVYFGMGQFDTYFTEGDSIPIRLKLLQDGVKIANQHYPLGAGFATFGTTVAYTSGSKFYYQFGYMSGYYLNQPVADAFWPGVFGEAGWFGCAFFALGVILMAVDSLKKLKENKYFGWSMISILAYAVFCSTAETAFFNPATAFMFIIYGIASGSAGTQNALENKINSK